MRNVAYNNVTCSACTMDKIDMHMHKQLEGNRCDDKSASDKGTPNFNNMLYYLLHI
jgi:hypothetical protein